MAATPGPTWWARCSARASVILLKDVDGLYTADPKTHPEPTFIPDIRAAELIRMQLPTLPIEPVVLELLTRAKLVTQHPHRQRPGAGQSHARADGRTGRHGDYGVRG